MAQSKHKLYCLVGRTGSGKSYLAKDLARHYGLTVLKSYTTRPPRDNETFSNSDHIFLTEEQMDEIPREFMVAYTEINGYRYCCTLNQILTSDIYVIDPKGIEYLKEKEKFLSNVDLKIIYVNCGDIETRKERFLQRDNTTEEDFYNRNAAEDEQFTDFELNGTVDYEINNSFDTDEAILQLRSIAAFGIFETMCEEGGWA